MVKVEKFGPNDSDKLKNNYKPNCLIIVTHPGCGHCQAMKPALNEVYDDLKTYTGDAQVYDIHANAANEAKEKITDLNIVDGYPTLFISKQNEKPIVYSGDRSKETIIKFMTDNLDIKKQNGGKKTRKNKTKSTKTKSTKTKSTKKSRKTKSTKKSRKSRSIKRRIR